MPMQVADFLFKEAIIPVLASATKGAVLAEMSTFLADRYRGHGEPGSLDAAVLLHLLEERERKSSSALGEAIAIPHAKLASVHRMVGALGRSPSGLAFDSLDGNPTHLIFLLVAPPDAADDHLKALARIVRLFREGDFRRRLMDAMDDSAMYRIITEEDAKL